LVRGTGTGTRYATWEEFGTSGGIELRYAVRFVVRNNILIGMLWINIIILMKFLYNQFKLTLKSYNLLRNRKKNTQFYFFKTTFPQVEKMQLYDFSYRNIVEELIVPHRKFYLHRLVSYLINKPTTWSQNKANLSALCIETVGSSIGNGTFQLPILISLN
jgi:hypothetical protein